MWELVINLVGPVALEALERVFRRRDAAVVTASHHTDTESRLLSLEKQVEALREVEAKEVEELARVLRVIGLRASVALWLGIFSTATTLVVIALTVFRS